jgi:hypothetical protein
MSRISRWLMGRGAALVVLLVPALAATAAAQGALPSGREVIDRYIAAIGGRDAILAQTGRHGWGKLEVPAQGMTGNLELYSQPPNKLLARVTIAGIGEVLTGYDGTTAWGINPMVGPTILDSLELRQMKQRADTYSDLYDSTQIANLETVSRGPLAAADSADCYKVKVTTTWGESYFEYFDASTGLRVATQRSQASPMGSVETIAVAGDWHTVEGVKKEFTVTQYTMGIKQVVTVDSLRAMTVPDSIFALPPEIQALVKK